MTLYWHAVLQINVADQQSLFLSIFSTLDKILISVIICMCHLFKKNQHFFNIVYTKYLYFWLGFLKTFGKKHIFMLIFSCLNVLKCSVIKLRC